MDMHLGAKQRRLRLHGTHRWSQTETEALLTTILDEVKERPDSFEQPTAYEFYKRIAAKSIELQGIDLRVFRNKMRNLKTNYVKALWMKRGKTQGPEVAGMQNFKNMCPYWDLLDKLFAQTKREKPQQEQFHIEPVQVQTLVDVPYEPGVGDGVKISDYFIETHTSQIDRPIKILGRPRNSSRNIAALSRMVEMHDNKLNFEAFKWHKQLKYNDHQLELEQGKLELRLMEYEDEFEKKKAEMLLHESEALEKLKSKVALLERIRIQELTLKQHQ